MEAASKTGGETGIRPRPPGCRRGVLGVKAPYRPPRRRIATGSRPRRYRRGSTGSQPVRPCTKVQRRAVLIGTIAGSARQRWYTVADGCAFQRMPSFTLAAKRTSTTIYPAALVGPSARMPSRQEAKVEDHPAHSRLSQAVLAAARRSPISPSSRPSASSSISRRCWRGHRPGHEVRQHALPGQCGAGDRRASRRRRASSPSCAPISSSTWRRWSATICGTRLYDKFQDALLLLL